jgi:simple sugar transport system ATP-binding protein
LTPHQAKALGIQVIFQDLSLFPNLTVLENIAIDLELGSALKPPPRRAMRETALAALARLDAHLPLDARSADLSVAQRQIVAICRGWPPTRGCCSWTSRPHR